MWGSFQSPNRLALDLSSLYIYRETTFINQTQRNQSNQPVCTPTMESSPPLHKRLRRSSESNGERRPPRGELLVDEILTRLPIAAAVRFRAVCRQWNAALTSDHFILAHRARAAAARHRHPELLFIAPGAAFAGGRATSSSAPSPASPPPTPCVRRRRAEASRSASTRTGRSTISSTSPPATTSRCRHASRPRRRT